MGRGGIIGLADVSADAVPVDWVVVRGVGWVQHFFYLLQTQAIIENLGVGYLEKKTKRIDIVSQSHHYQHFFLSVADTSHHRKPWCWLS